MIAMAACGLSFHRAACGFAGWLRIVPVPAVLDRKWSVAVVVIVAVLVKASDGWKLLWFRCVAEADMPMGHALGAMFAIRSFALMVQPFVMGALIGVGYDVAIIVVGVICLACAALFSRVVFREPYAQADARRLAANST